MSSDPESPSADQNETYGPKVGVRISLEQADLIIRRHFPTRRAKDISHINRGYNNRVYIVTTVENSEIESDTSQDSQDYIIRLSGRFWTRYKTENEVAALLQMGKIEAIPVPKVYGYCTDKTKSEIDAEYILMDKVEGVPLEHVWRKPLDPQGKMFVIDQLAKIFAAIHEIRFDKIGSFQFLPEVGDVHGIGIFPQEDFPEPRSKLRVAKGVEFDGGPFDTFLEYIKSSCETEIEELRKTEFMKSCEGYQNRLERIERFVSALESLDTLPEGIDKDAVTNVPFVFTHGDLEPRNLMVNPETLEITSILDWEFSGSYPIEEDWYTGFRFVDSDISDFSVFREFKLNGDNEKGPELVNTPEIRDYFLEKMRENGATVPDDMLAHCMVRAELYYFKGFICPWWLREERDPLPESHFRDRDNSCKNVDAILNKYGF